MIKKIILSVFALLVISLGLLFTLDLGFLRGSIEKKIEAATGRDFAFGENVSIHLGSELVIDAGGLKLGNAQWAGTEPFVSVGTMHVVIDTLSLFEGLPVIKQLDLDDVKVLLQQNSEGLANWQMGTVDSEDAVSEQLPFLAEAVLLSNASIELQSPLLDQPIHVVINRLVDRIEADGLIHTSIEGLMSGKPIQVDLISGPYDNLITGNNFTIEGQGSFGNISVFGIAEFDNLWAPERPTFDLQVSGPELEELTQMLGINGLGRGDLSFSAIGAVDNEVLTTRVLGNFGELEMDITNQLSSLQETKGAKITANINGPNFGRVARLAGLESWPQTSFSLTTDLQYLEKGLQIDGFNLSLAGARVSLAGNVPDFPAARGAELKLEISGDDLAPFQAATGLPTLPKGQFSLNGDVASDLAGQTRVNVQFVLPFGAGGINGVLGGSEDLIGTAIEFAANGENASKLGPVIGVAGMESGPWSMAANLAVSQRDLLEITDGAFNTEILSAGLDGIIGLQSVEKGTDIHITVSADRMSDLQWFAGEDIVLPDQPFSVDGKVKAQPDTWQLTDFQVNVGTTKFSINGILGKDDMLNGSALTIDASGEDPGKMFELPGLARLPDGPFTAAMQLSLIDDRLNAKEVKISAGPFSLNLNADIPWPPDNSRGSFEVQSSGLDIARILPELAGLKPDPGEWSLQAEGGWADGKISIKKGAFSIADSELTALGVLDLPPNLSATDFEVTLKSPDLSRIGTIDGVHWGSVPVDIKTSFAGTNTRLDMNRFSAKVGEGVFEGKFFVDFEPEIPEFGLDVTTDSFDLKPFQTSSDNSEEDSAPEKGALLIPEMDLPLEALASVNGHFSIHAERALLSETTLLNTVFEGELRSGSLFLTRTGVDGYKGQLISSAALVPDGAGGAVLTINSNSEGLILNLVGHPDEDMQALPAFDISLQLEAKGKTVRELAATLNGSFTAESSGGLVKNIAKKNASDLLLAKLLSAISPSTSKQEVIQISCVAAVMKIQDGVVMLDPGFALQSEKLNIFATGNINLASENVDVNFRTQTRSAAKLSASELISPYVKLSGTLANPSIALDAKGTLISGGAAFLSGGLSILAKKALDQIGGTSNPCEGMVVIPD